MTKPYKGRFVVHKRNWGRKGVRLNGILPESLSESFELERELIGKELGRPDPVSQSLLIIDLARQNERIAEREKQIIKAKNIKRKREQRHERNEPNTGGPSSADFERV